MPYSHSPEFSSSNVFFFWGVPIFRRTQIHHIVGLHKKNDILIELYRYFPVLSLEVYWTNLWYIPRISIESQSSPYRPRAVGAPSTKVDTSSVPVRGGKAGFGSDWLETLQVIQLRTLIQGFKKGLENVEWSHSLGLRMMRMLICRDVEWRWMWRETYGNISWNHGECWVSDRECGRSGLKLSGWWINILYPERVELWIIYMSITDSKS